MSSQKSDLGTKLSNPKASTSSSSVLYHSSSHTRPSLPLNPFADTRKIPPPQIIYYKPNKLSSSGITSILSSSQKSDPSKTKEIDLSQFVASPRYKATTSSGNSQNQSPVPLSTSHLYHVKSSSSKDILSKTAPRYYPPMKLPSAGLTALKPDLVKGKVSHPEKARVSWHTSVSNHDRSSPDITALDVIPTSDGTEVALQNPMGVTAEEKLICSQKGCCKLLPPQKSYRYRRCESCRTRSRESHRAWRAKKNVEAVQSTTATTEANFKAWMAKLRSAGNLTRSQGTTVLGKRKLDVDLQSPPMKKMELAEVSSDMLEYQTAKELRRALKIYTDQLGRSPLLGTKVNNFVGSYTVVTGQTQINKARVLQLLPDLLSEGALKINSDCALTVDENAQDDRACCRLEYRCLCTSRPCSDISDSEDDEWMLNLFDHPPLNNHSREAKPCNGRVIVEMREVFLQVNLQRRISGEKVIVKIIH